jgi:hypothetical protein
MRGYEDTFSDIIDFIVRVTHRIWEEKAIGYLYEHLLQIQQLTVACIQ